MASFNVKLGIFELHLRNAALSATKVIGVLFAQQIVIVILLIYAVLVRAVGNPARSEVHFCLARLRRPCFFRKPNL